ncbi:hypothetical protein F4678DRAFT_453249 [Xylaria arbuscula]|nr:hypothetical protein F4678DRAFT_453249 [Xylaria arbuscula]
MVVDFGEANDGDDDADDIGGVFSDLDDGEAKDLGSGILSSDASIMSTTSVQNHLSQEHSVEGCSGAVGPWADLDIARHLVPDSSSDTTLPEWIAHQLAQTDDTFAMMRSWCSFWQDRMAIAKTAEEQLITRSLILHSAHVVKSFHASSIATVADVYMLLDVGAWDKPSEEAPHKLQSLVHMPRFTTYTEAKNRYIESLGSSSEGVAYISAQIFTQQVEHFHSIQKDPMLFRYTKDCISLAEIRLRFMLRHAIASDAPILLECDGPWDSTLFARLRLSNWQILAAMQPAADLQLILTDYQLQVYKKHQSSVDFSETERLTPQLYEGDC